MKNAAALEQSRAVARHLHSSLFKDANANHPPDGGAFLNFCLFFIFRRTASKSFTLRCAAGICARTRAPNAKLAHGQNYTTCLCVRGKLASSSKVGTKSTP